MRRVTAPWLSVLIWSACAPPPASTPPAGTEQRIDGRTGGTVTLGDELTLLVPAGSLQEDVVIGVSRLQPSAWAAPPGFASTAQGYELTPHGTFFSPRVPAVLSVKLDVQALAARGLDPRTARVFYVDPEEGSTTGVPSAFDSERGRVVAALEHFSKYVILAQAAAASGTGPTVVTQGTFPTPLRADTPLLLRATASPGPGTSIVSVRVRYEKRPFVGALPGAGPNARVAEMAPDRSPAMPGANAFQLLVPSSYLTTADLGPGSDFRYFFEATDSLGMTAQTPLTARNINASLAPGSLTLTPPSLTISAGFENWISMSGVDGSGTPFAMAAESATASACPDGRPVGLADNQLASGIHFTAQSVCSGSVAVTAGVDTVSLPVNVTAGALDSITLYRYEAIGLAEVRTGFDGTCPIKEGTVLDLDALGHDAEQNPVLVNVDWQAQPQLGTIDATGTLYALDGAGFGTVSAQVGGFGPSAVQWFEVLGRSWLPRGAPLNLGNALVSSFPTGNLVSGSVYHTTTKLPDGRVLLAGRAFDLATNAQLYDPTTNTWSATATGLAYRTGHTATLLPNGKVLVVGGTQDGANPLSGNALFDPATNTWSPASSLAAARWNHAAIPLRDGRVLVMGGTSSCSFGLCSTMGSAELYDPSTGAWMNAAPMLQPGASFQAVRLGDGRVLALGATSEIYDPVTNAWSPAATPSAYSTAGTVTLLQNGRVLFAGGWSSASAELYDPASNTWSPTSPLSVPRAGHQATLLPSGDVLVTGGADTVTGLGLVSAEVYRTATGTWTAASDTRAGHVGHQATLLGGGDVLITGGYSAPGAGEVYVGSTASPVPPLPSITMAGSTPWVAWHEPGIWDHVRVQHWDGASWVPDGVQPLNVDQGKTALYPQIALAPSAPAVAWQEDGATATQVYVKQWSGASWVQLGAGSLNVGPTRNAGRPAIAASGSAPHVAWSESTATGTAIYVRRWNPATSSWALLGGNLATSPAGNAVTPSIAIVGGTPSVAWREDTGGTGQIFVKRWTGSSWALSGAALNASPAGDASDPALAVSGSILFASWRETQAGLSQVHVAHWSGSAWVLDGPGLTNDPTQPVSRPAIAFFGATPYVAWSEGPPGSAQLVVKHLNAGTWRQNGPSLNVDPAAGASAPSIALDGATPVLSWSEVSSGAYSVRVKTLE